MPEITKALADLFALCDDLFAQVTDASATEMGQAGTERSDARRRVLRRSRPRQRWRGTVRVYLRSRTSAAVDREWVAACVVVVSRFLADFRVQIGRPPAALFDFECY